MSCVNDCQLPLYLMDRILCYAHLHRLQLLFVIFDSRGSSVIQDATVYHF